MRSAGGAAGQAFSTNMLYRKAGQDSDEPAPTTENLGNQTINGTHATGTRITNTIPSGKMGHDKPIVLSKELRSRLSRRYPDKYWPVIFGQFNPIEAQTAPKLKSSLSATQASYCTKILEARVGIEPTHKGFADLSLTTWVPRPLR